MSLAKSDSNQIDDVHREAPMVNDSPRSDMYSMFIELEFRYYERMLRTTEEHLRSDQDAFWSVLDKQAQGIVDSEERNDFYVLHVDVDPEFEHLRKLSMNAIFVASVALFEFKLLQLCELVDSQIGDTDGVKASGRSMLNSAKSYLKDHGLRGPFTTEGWHDANRYYSIRNLIVHRGGCLPIAGDITDFAKRKQIVYQPRAILQIVQGVEQPPPTVALNRAFCEEVLNNLKHLLYALHKAWQETARQGSM